MPGGRFSVEAVFRAIDRFTRPIRKMERHSKRFMRGLKSGMGALMTGIGRVKVYAAAAAAGVALLGAKVIKTGAEYEQAITNVGAVMLKHRDQIKVLDDKAKQLGATTKFTATQAAEGMELMARAGFKEEEILSGIEGVLSAAAASGMELAETTGHVSNVLKGMGLAASETTRVADVLALASSRTNSTIGSLGESMKNVASTARQLNIPLEHVVSAVANLQDVGLDASVAGSALNTMLTKLAKPTADITRKMKKWGVTFKDAHGNMLPLPEVLENLATAAKKSGGNLDQVAFFADLVGLRGQKAATNLKDLLLSGKFNELADALRNAKGAADKMAAIKMETAKGQFDLLKSAVDNMMTSIYDSAAKGALKDLVGSMRELVEQHKYAVEAHAQVAAKQAKEGAGAWGAAWDDAWGVYWRGFTGFWDSLTGEKGNAEDTLDILRLLAGLLAGLAGYGLVLASTLGVVLYAALWFLVQVFKILAAVVVAVVWFFAYDLPDALGKAWNAVSGFFGDLWDAIADLFSSEGLGWLKDHFKAGGQAIVQGFIDGFKASWGWLKSTASEFGKVLWGGIKKALGISSPSRQATLFGEATSEGFAKGIEKGLPKIHTQLAKMAELPTRGHLRLVHSVEHALRANDNARIGGAAEGERPMLRSVAAGEVARSVTESRETSDAVVTLRDETGRAEITKEPRSRGVKLRLERTGTF